MCRSRAPRSIAKSWRRTARPIVSVDLDVNNSSSKMIETTVNMLVKPKNFKGDVAIDYARNVQLQPGRTTVKLVKTIQEPELWWTWDHGKPNPLLC